MTHMRAPFSSNFGQLADGRSKYNNNPFLHFTGSTSVSTDGRISEANLPERPFDPTGV